jgi:hypothetical protein
MKLIAQSTACRPDNFMIDGLVTTASVPPIVSTGGTEVFQWFQQPLSEIT